jgi:hypothetical protein
MSFEIPKITQLPTVAITAQAGTPSETDQNSCFRNSERRQVRRAADFLGRGS